MYKCAVLIVLALARAEERKPLYKYRYETEDVMKTAASSVPVHGYHVVEGGYYPEAAGLGRLRNFGGYGGGYGGNFGSFGGGGFGGGFGGYYPHGGEYFDRSNYGNGNKHLNDESYQHAGGNSHEEARHGQEGFNQGKVALRNDKGDSGFYNGQEGGKKVAEDGKSYNGAQHFNQEGKNADEDKQKSGHKKGHVVKGFKTSHHKDESGKTEEYYDEENDEGGRFNLKGSSGAFGENAQSSFKGGHENGQFNAAQSKKEGHYDNAHVIDNSNGDKGQYGQKKTYGNGQTYGINNGVGEQSLLGHQENNRIYKHHIPFIPQY